jgi:hypothetical protein
MDDLRTVMDAVEAERPALFGISEGGPMSILFAATYPERVQSLVLYGTLPRFTPELPHYPWGFTAEKLAEYRDEIETHWGEGALAELLFGPIAEVPGFRDYYGRIQRLSASPTMAMMLWDSLMHIDVRAVLNTIRVPTLVLARHGDLINTVEAGAAWAQRIPGAKFEELPPGPHGLFDDAMASAVLDFACGTHADAPTERVLSAVLFTDIVGSTDLPALAATCVRVMSSRTTDCRQLAVRYGVTRQAHRRRRVRALRRPHQGGSVCSNWCRPWRRAASTSGWASTSANASGAATTGAVWRSMSEHVSTMADPMKCASRTVRDLSAGSSTASGPIASRVSRKPPKSSVSRPSGRSTHNCTTGYQSGRSAWCVRDGAAFQSRRCRYPSCPQFPAVTDISSDHR